MHKISLEELKYRLHCLEERPLEKKNEKIQMKLKRQIRRIERG